MTTSACILRGGGSVFGRARNFSPVPDESRRCLRNRLARLAAIIAYIRKLALALIFEALMRVFRAVKVALVPADYDYTWQGDTNEYPFDTQEFLTPRQNLAAKSLAKQLAQESEMVIVVANPYISKPVSNATVTSPSTDRLWASASPTPGLSNVIDTKRSAAILAEARANNSPFLIGSSKRHARA